MCAFLQDFPEFLRYHGHTAAVLTHGGYDGLPVPVHLGHSAEIGIDSEDFLKPEDHFPVERRSAGIIGIFPIPEVPCQHVHVITVGIPDTQFNNLFQIFLCLSEIDLGDLFIIPAKLGGKEQIGYHV